jgi:predicted transcriptional regulator
MGSQLNLRVSDEFARKLERLARSTGQPMAAVLEAVSTPALDEAEADARFEAEALEAWEAYQLTGEAVETRALDGLFSAATPARRRKVRGTTQDDGPQHRPRR